MVDMKLDEGVAEQLVVQADKMRRANKEAEEEKIPMGKSLQAAIAISRHFYRLRFKAMKMQEVIIVAEDDADAQVKGKAIAASFAGGVFIHVKPLVYNLPKKEDAVAEEAA